MKNEEKQLLEKFDRTVAWLARVKAYAEEYRSAWHRDFWLRADVLRFDMVKMNKQRRIKLMQRWAAKEAA